ncbi:MAG TPA: M23 family metallopeptidase [Bacillota bacterium]|nr:M23 family metallopeptidase [Bacillota bacterium]HOL15518.1 M23 family metallopeptidase [Bacillota bacterium]
MIYRRRRAPVSTLRARLQQRLAEKEGWDEKSDSLPDDSISTPKPFFLLSLWKSMHRYLLVKITVAVVILFAAALLTWGGYGWGEPMLRAMRFVVEWDLKPDSFSREVVPAFRLIWDNMKLPSQEPGGASLPLAGKLCSGFGLREDAAAGREQMHYGIDLAAPEGSAVRAFHPGIVEQISAVAGAEDLHSVVVSVQPGWLMIYRGLTAVAVKEGDAVEAGTLLGKLGPPRLYDLPHLHIELRSNGHPVAPPEDWLARFTSDAAL